METAATVIAISTSIMALAALAVAVGVLTVVHHFNRVGHAVESLVGSLQTEAKPLVENAKTLVADATRIAGKLGAEVEGVVDTSHDLRQRVMYAVDSVEDRLVDLDALLDVIQTEVEETVLDVGAALRTTRRSASILGKMRRTLLGGGKRRKRR